MNPPIFSKKNIGKFLLAFFLSTAQAFAITIRVPADQPTIAAAVSAANSGDIIVLAPGTSIESNPILIDKQLTITSQWHETGDEQFITQTVLDGVSSSHTMFETVDNFGVNVEISGLTFTRFLKPIVINDSAVIKKNIFTHNSSDSISFEATGYGYAGFNTIEDSTDDGIDVDATEGTLTIEFNTLRNNGDEGIEIRLLTGSQPNMIYDIHDNILSGNGEDGLQLIDHASTDSGRVFNIYKNVFDGNAMAGLGSMPGGNTRENFGGADITERVNFHNNTVINNVVGITGGDNFIALNNIIANNTNTGVKRLRGGAVLAYNSFYNNGTHLSDAITDTGNSFDINPQFDPFTYKLLPGSPGIDSGVATFTWNGQLVLNLDSSKYIGSAPDLGAKEFDSGGTGGNSAPVVRAGPDQVILAPTNSTTLEGQVSDDGLPNPPGAVTATWVQTIGPGNTAFADANTPVTTATFPAAQQGIYQLTMSGDDGELTASDSVVVRYAKGGSGETVPIQAPGNTFFEAERYAYFYGTAREISDVNASGNIAIEAPLGSGTHAFSEHTLVVTEQNATFYVWVRGKGFDQNSDSLFVSLLDNPERAVTVSSDNTYRWFQVPGSYTMTAGVWPLIIRAGEAGVVWDQIVFSTEANFVPGENLINTMEFRVSASADDAEESASGKISLTSSDLELVFDGNNQTVGLRFNAVNIPKNASITQAYVQFKTDETQSEATSLTIHGQNADNAAAFTTATRNISSRATTAASVLWAPVPWTTIGQAGVDQRTANIASIVQEIVNRTGWSAGNSLALIISGTGHRTAEAFNGDQAGAPLLHVEYRTGPPVNQPPVVNAGPDQTIRLPDSALLNPTVSDDGLPAGATVTAAWSQVSGPGTVSFGNPNAVNTTASFSAEGAYVLRLTADDGDKTAFDDIAITVQPEGIQLNQAPNVDAGLDQTITLPNSAALNATVSDDGLPAGSTVIATWSQVSGPGTVSFADPAAVNTMASFSAEGTYTLRLTADDSALVAFDEVAITVQPPGAQSTVFESRVSASADDAEESASGKISLTSSDLELVFDGNNQTVGLRFNAVNIPKNASITQAYVQFKTDEAQSEATSLTIQGQNTDNAAAFTTATRNISSRAKTAASVAWTPGPWTTVGQAGSEQRTTDIAPIVQEIVNRSGWSGGNSLALVLSGTGHRTAEAFNGDQAGAPLLHVEYQK